MVGDSLLTLQPVEAARVAFNTEESLEVVTIEVTRWFFGGVVGHQVDDEIVRSRHDDDGREGTGEVVWVVGDTFVLCFFELGSELVESVAIAAVVDRDVVDLLEACDVERVCVAVVDVGIATANGGVSLVVVVRVRETLTGAEDSACEKMSVYHITRLQQFWNTHQSGHPGATDHRSTKRLQRHYHR